MSFRKRNTVIRSAAAAAQAQNEKWLLPGTRPSPLDGRLTTSTGTVSLDQVLAGHSGLPLGTSLLIEESGATDFGGVLIRYFAAEGLVQGHCVYVLGFRDGWRRELPGLLGKPETSSQRLCPPGSDKMKIAWRYEGLGSPAVNKARETASQAGSFESSGTFCHSFDLSKRLEASSIQGQLATLPSSDTSSHDPLSVFSQLIKDLHARLKASPSVVHRVIVPSLLSPALYSTDTCEPQAVLQFLHGLRSLLRQYPTQLTALVTLPISLHPRSSGLCKWIENLFDGVIELVNIRKTTHQTKSGDGAGETQGLVRIHALPIFHEKGGGLLGRWKREDMSFRLSASSGLLITPFSLPPIGTDEPGVSFTKSKPENFDF